MLKKFMIICLALSFVFIGGIAFAADEAPVVPEEGQTISTESADSPVDITPPADPKDLTTQDIKTVIGEGDELKGKVIELKDKVIEEGGDVQK